MRVLERVTDLIRLAEDLPVGASAPCLLREPQFLERVGGVDFCIQIREEAAGVLAFQPVPEHAAGPHGLARGDGGFQPIRDALFASGITRVSPADLDQALQTIEAQRSESMAIADVSSLFEADFLQARLHTTPHGPVAVFSLNVQLVLPDALNPAVAINPFGRQGWTYLQQLLETATLFWSIGAPGHKAVFVFQSTQPWYPLVVEQIHRRAVQERAKVKTFNFRAAVRHLRAGSQG
jgi:hypothetical protein